MVRRAPTREKINSIMPDFQEFRLETGVLRCLPCRDGSWQSRRRSGASRLLGLGRVVLPNRMIIISCEHGGNALPAVYAPLFRDYSVALASHRGWDPGALLLAEKLASLLRAPLFSTTISRLLVDANRSPESRNLFSEISRPLSSIDKSQILDRYYLPHRQQILDAVSVAIDSGKSVLHLAIHSFTPVLDGKTRNADLGLLYDSKRAKEGRFCQAWRTELKKARPDLIIRRNYPYLGQSDGLATWLRRRYTHSQYLGIEVEINQRRLTDPIDSVTMAKALAQTLAGNRLKAITQSMATHASKDELVAIVDTDNRVVGQASRSEMRRQNLTHRATYILVFNKKGEIFVQKRTMIKDIYPGFFDIAAGGVVQHGESYEESARRELLEELGVTAELEFLFDRYFADEQNKVWGRVYRCRHEGPFVLQQSEVESGSFMMPEEIISATATDFTPDGLAILASLLARDGEATRGRR